jgi:hypothetical protein
MFIRKASENCLGVFGKFDQRMKERMQNWAKPSPFDLYFAVWCRFFHPFGNIAAAYGVSPRNPVCSR